MNKKTLGFQIVTAIALFAAATIPAFAQLNLGTTVNASVNGTSVSANANASARTSTSMAKGQDRGDTMIQDRITSLTDLETRISAMTKVSASDKSTLDANIQTQIGDLTTLKTKIDADTTAASLKADDKSITDAYRIYMLVLPQGRIAAASDRALDIGTSFATLSTKLQKNITTASSAGNNVTSLNASLSDMNAKVADSNTQANAAVSLVANLQPDNGNATVAASNTAAIKSARADITAANNDLKAAYADAKSIVSGLKSFNVSTSTTASAQ